MKCTRQPVGCHSDAHAQAKWFGDDMALKSINYDHEPSGLPMAAAGMRMLGGGHAPLHRFRLGLELALSGHREVDDMVGRHRFTSAGEVEPEPRGSAEEIGRNRSGA